MAKVKRQIISIDEPLCNGCGSCVPSCVEGALQIVNGKARLIKESFCDGLGACLGECPQGALTIVEIEADAYDERQVPAHPCPGVRLAQWEVEERFVAPAGRGRSELRQWPVQLHLLPVQAPFFENADLLLVADCVPFAYANFHEDFVRGHAVAMGCPKLDDARAYVDKVTQILLRSNVKSLKVAYMEVPCCRGLVQIALQALAASGKEIPFETEMITIGA